MEFVEFWVKEKDEDGKTYLRPISFEEVKETLNSLVASQKAQG